MTEFKVGDRVVAIGEHDENRTIINKSGTVLWISTSRDGQQYLSIEFDGKIHRGHMGINGEGKDGYCWNIPQCLAKLEKPYVVNLI